MHCRERAATAFDDGLFCVRHKVRTTFSACKAKSQGPEQEAAFHCHTLHEETSIYDVQRISVFFDPLPLSCHLRFSPSTFAALSKSRVCSEVWTSRVGVTSDSCLPPQKTRFCIRTHLLSQPLICKELQTWTGKISACLLY